MLLFTLSATLLLSCGLGVFYWIVVRHAFEEDNAVLADKVAEIRADLKQPGGIETIDRESKSRRGGEPAAYWVRILDPAGVVLAETPGMDRLLPTKLFLPEGSASILRSPQDYQTGAQLFSLLATTETFNGQIYTIEVAQDRSTDERFRKQFRALLVLVLALGIVASALIAITVTRRGLRSLGEMTRSLERVRPAHLNERIEPARWPRELRPLAASFDDVLVRLESSFTRLSQFSADLAHELRTPLANMIGEAQVTLTRERSSDEYRSVIESTVAECERLSGIVDNLLFLARAESADQQIQCSHFNARAAVEKIVAYYQTVAEDRDITLACEGEGELFADPVLFNRALSNLLDNALRFTSDAGRIQISIVTRGANIEISVADTGCGITAEHLPHVFDRFYRADSSRSSTGTGLGLALVKSIVDLHGGSATIESELDHGTTVVLTFPNQPGLESKN